MDLLLKLGDDPVWPRQGDAFTIGDAFLVSIIAIVLVFLILVIIIGGTHGVKIVTEKADDKVNINPKNPSNKLLAEDDDAVVAALTATIDFHKETGKDAEIKSIERIDE